LKVIAITLIFHLVQNKHNHIWCTILVYLALDLALTTTVTWWSRVPVNTKNNKKMVRSDSYLHSHSTSPNSLLLLLLLLIRTSSAAAAVAVAVAANANFRLQ
jgi:hypothetical protein